MLKLIKNNIPINILHHIILNINDLLKILFPHLKESHSIETPITSLFSNYLELLS